MGTIEKTAIDEEPYLVGKDVAEILGYKNTRKALLNHVDEEEKLDGVTIRDSIGSMQKVVVINESGFYSLVFSSKLPAAKKFKHWVKSEILPRLLLAVFCKTFLEKNANCFWRILHLQIGENCKMDPVHF